MFKRIIVGSTGLRAQLLTLALALCAGNALAATPASTVHESNSTNASSPGGKKAADTGDADDSDEPSASTQGEHETTAPSSHTAEAQPMQIPVRPPPKPPRPEDQELRPYVAPVELKTKDRHLVLSVVAGSWWHSLNGQGASTRVGPVWGVSGRVDPYRWMGIRVSILRGNQPESPNYGALGVPNTLINQPDFQIIYWSIRMEPTWHVTNRFSLWAGTGLGWARAIVPEPSVGTSNWVSADRSCVYVEGQWAMGAQYELLRDWLMLGVDLSAGVLGYQSGSAHDSAQAFTPDGHMRHIGGYPDFSRKIQALLGLGVIL
jgi:hypothetical protein